MVRNARLGRDPTFSSTGEVLGRLARDVGTSADGSHYDTGAGAGPRAEDVNPATG